MAKIGNISETTPGAAVINDTVESAESVYSSEKVQSLISEIELLPGPQGEQGIQGPTGATGSQGIQGIQGETGQAGSDASVTKENVEAVLTGEISSHTHSGSSSPTSWGKYF